jgi:hypothetical protein
VRDAHAILRRSAGLLDGCATAEASAAANARRRFPRGPCWFCGGPHYCGGGGPACKAGRADEFARALAEQEQRLTTVQQAAQRQLQDLQAAHARLREENARLRAHVQEAQRVAPPTEAEWEALGPRARLPRAELEARLEESSAASGKKVRGALLREVPPAEPLPAVCCTHSLGLRGIESARGVSRSVVAAGPLAKLLLPSRSEFQRRSWVVGALRVRLELGAKALGDGPWLWKEPALKGAKEVGDGPWVVDREALLVALSR